MTTLYLWDTQEIEMRDMEFKTNRDDHSEQDSHLVAAGLARLLSDHAAGCDIDVILYAMVSYLAERLRIQGNIDSALDYLARHGRDVMMASIERVRDGHG
jgi:hypothetical protein